MGGHSLVVVSAGLVSATGVRFVWRWHVAMPWLWGALVVLRVVVDCGLVCQNSGCGLSRFSVALVS